jgi:hypothetical protein
VSSLGSSSVPAELHANRMQWLIRLCVIHCHVSYVDAWYASIYLVVCLLCGGLVCTNLSGVVVVFTKRRQAGLSFVKVSSVKMILYLRALMKFCPCFLLCLIWVKFSAGFFHKNLLSCCKFHENWCSEIHTLLRGIN